MKETDNQQSKSASGNPCEAAGSVSVIKVGGAVVEDPALLSVLLDSFMAVPGPKVLVHGGGRSATTLAAQLGIQSQMVGGRRITDARMLRIVTMVYGGLVNKNIVAQLQARRINALGLTGADLNLIRAHRRPVTPEGIDFGFVGDVDSADGQRLLSLLQDGITPVIAPLTHDGQGNLLNTNADTMAQTVATALAAAISASPDVNITSPVPTSSPIVPSVSSSSPTAPSIVSSSPIAPPVASSSPSSPSVGCSAYSRGTAPSLVTLTFCFELPGVLRDPSDPSTLIPRLTEADFRALVADGTIAGGMIPKLENAFAALRAGVAAVRITNIHNLQGGTVIN